MQRRAQGKSSGTGPERAYRPLLYSLSQALSVGIVFYFMLSSALRRSWRDPGYKP